MVTAGVGEDVLVVDVSCCSRLEYVGHGVGFVVAVVAVAVEVDEVESWKNGDWVCCGGVWCVG